MSGYRATFNTNICIEVEVDETDEDYAADVAWEIAEEYLTTLTHEAASNQRIVTVEASLDGIGADDMQELS